MAESRMFSVVTEYAPGVWQRCKVCGGWGCLDAQGQTSCSTPQDTVTVLGPGNGIK